MLKRKTVDQANAEYERAIKAYLASFDFNPDAKMLVLGTAFLDYWDLEGSNRVIRGLRAALGKDFPIIGVGGILSGHDAIAKIEAGADVVQIYTGLIYKGPELVTEVASALQQMKR